MTGQERHSFGTTYGLWWKRVDIVVVRVWPRNGNLGFMYDMYRLFRSDIIYGAYSTYINRRWLFPVCLSYVRRTSYKYETECVLCCTRYGYIQGVVSIICAHTANTVRTQPVLVTDRTLFHQSPVLPPLAYVAGTTTRCIVGSSFREEWRNCTYGTCSYVVSNFLRTVTCAACVGRRLRLSL